MWLLFLMPFSTYAQSQDYWQQEVNYKIRVELDDQNHTLEGNLQIQYINNSPDQLEYIYFHLWPNAYKNLQTAFAEQKREAGSTEFYYSEPDERGSISQLDFMVGDDQVRWYLDSNHIDICKILLNEPLAPGDSIMITTPFKVDLPQTFSRLGHNEQAYQITQWYPKPAVYDEDGWHPMPYLDQGEFYSEYGTFDVFITVPENYVVGATGNLMTKSEREWLNKKARQTARKDEYGQTDTFPESSAKTKTLHYREENIHDFAWFADKRYHVLKDSVELPSGKTVTTWSYFRNRGADRWKKSPEYLKDAVYNYSKWVGTYPYDNVSAVQGALGAGSGMEYPTITVIGEAGSDRSLDRVITHEAGHNWFYGILGFNERRWPWMDEGMNSYYENRYMDKKYPNRSFAPLPNQFDPLLSAVGLDYLDGFDTNHLLYQFVARRNVDQPTNTHSADFSRINYFVMNYMKTAIALRHLERYLGQDLFDEVMQQFYDQWQFQHPHPDDFERLFTKNAGQNLSWFFTDLLKTNKKLDYAIADVEKRAGRYYVKVRNKGDINAPYPISGIKNDSAVVTKWYDGHERVEAVVFPDGDFDRLRIDHNHVTLEYNRGDNTYKLNAIANKWEPLRLQPLASLENPYRSQIFIMPSLAWNNYDKSNIGLAFSNAFLPPQRFQYFLSPMFGTASKTLTGYGRVSYKFLPNNLFRQIKLGLYGERYSYHIQWRNGPDFYDYSKLEPSLTFFFEKDNARSNVQKKLTFRSHLIRQEVPDFNDEQDDTDNINQDSYINEATFSLTNNGPINPFSLDFSVEQGKGFLRSSFAYNYKLTYNEDDDGLNIRLFGGAFVDHSTTSSGYRNIRLQLNPSAGFYVLQNDYKFEETYLGRSARDGFFTQQISKKEGAFRSITSVGQTNDWLFALNVNSSIPWPVPIRPFGSVGVFPTTGFEDGEEVEKVDVAYELGGSIVLIENVIEVNFPFLTSQQIQDNHEARGRDKYYEKISFLLNLRVLELVDRIDGLPIAP
jgi:hypothetical protein